MAAWQFKKRIFPKLFIAESAFLERSMQENIKLTPIAGQSTFISGVVTLQSFSWLLVLAILLLQG